MSRVGILIKEHPSYITSLKILIELFIYLQGEEEGEYDEDADPDYNPQVKKIHHCVV